MIFRRAGFTAVSVTRRLNGGAEPSASAKKQLSQSTPVSRTAMICPSPCKPWSNSGIGPKAVPDWRVWIDSSFAKSGRERRRRTTANNLRIGRYERSRQARLIHEVTGNGSQVTGGVRGKDLSPVPRDPSPESMHELPPVADVIGQDVLAQPIRRRVEGAAAVDLRELFDEVHQQRIGGQHERRDRDTGAAAAVGLLERAVDDLHVEAERVRVEVPPLGQRRRLPVRNHEDLLVVVLSPAEDALRKLEPRLRVRVIRADLDERDLGDRHLHGLVAEEKDVDRVL